MKASRTLISVLFALCWSAVGQQASSTTPRSKPVFQWDIDHIEELDAKDAISLSKHLTATERGALIRIIAGRLARYNGEGMPGPKHNWRQLAEETRIKLVDLNGDGQLDVIAQAVGDDSGCSPTGNCPIWVFLKSGPTYKLILGRNAIQTFTIQQTRTNGFRDLILGMHSSATEEEGFLYQFRNGRYTKIACNDVNWERLVNGELVDLKKPDTTPCRD
jgi:hypothetical protein